ncbi:MAG: hypothetical protein LBI02_06765, partial [Opitutaceae bacterium]|nr:hypothetical protein [Opitutaceae bacterium]
MSQRTLPPLAWQVAPGETRDAAPKKWIPAAVPGAVQLDWARAHGWPEYWKGEHFRAYDGLEDFFWTYETRFPTPALAAGGRLFFACGGIDYAFELLLNGETLLRREGMFTPVDVELTGRVRPGGENILRVIVHPAPKSAPAPADRSQANRSCKPAVSYGWDFHPRLIPLGIWQDAFLDIRPACFLREVEVDYVLARDFSNAEVTATITLAAPAARPPARMPPKIDSPAALPPTRMPPKIDSSATLPPTRMPPKGARAFLPAKSAAPAAPTGADADGEAASRPPAASPAASRLAAPAAQPARASVRWTLRAPDGRELFCATTAFEPDEPDDPDDPNAPNAPDAPDTVTLRRTIANPALWWPHDQGAPALHTSSVELLDAAG